MKTLQKTKKFEAVICLKDNKVYTYNVDTNPVFSDNDFALIKCFLMKSDGKPDFSKEIEIYGKYLISHY
jgi:hypothetical protein